MQHDAQHPGSPFLEPSSTVDIRGRHLPHWQLDGGFYYVTSRLADSLPQAKLRAWKEEKAQWLQEHPSPWDEPTRKEYKIRFPKRIDAWLDRGYGECVLRQPECAQILFDVLLHFDGDRYNMASFVIMPNHMHTLFQLRGNNDLEDVLGSWKGYSARQINGYLARKGPLWQAESWDRLLRGVGDLVRCFSYIERNPVVAGLAQSEYRYYAATNFLPDTFKE